MTERELRANVVAIAKGFIGCKESDGSHKKIIDLYNSHKPLARGYAVKYTDAWCSTFASAVAIKAGLTDIIPTECGCEKHIQLFKKLGSWQENDAYVPSPADYIFYDWQDGTNYATTDNTGAADHVGIVEKVTGNTITIIEGNYSNAVKRRTLAVNGRYIRGYGVPDYASKATGTAGTAQKTYTVGKTNEETFVNFCREVLGLNLAGALGAAVNVGCESNFKTGAIGDSGTSYGICQWHAGRYTNLKNWCAANGLDYTTLDGQLWYMKHELETSYSAVLSYIRSVANTADGAYNAAYRWCLKFEIPANTEATSQKRGNLARDTYWPKYNGGTGTDTTKPTTTERKAAEAARSFDKGLAGTYAVNATNGLHIRSGAGTGKASMAVLPNGTKVRNYGYYTLTGGVKWLYIQVTYNGVTYTGFSSAQYLKKV